MFEDSVENVYNGGGAKFPFGDIKSSETVEYKLEKTTSSNSSFRPVESPVNGTAVIQINSTSSVITTSSRLAIYLQDICIYSEPLAKEDTVATVYVSTGDNIIVDLSTNDYKSASVTFIPFLLGDF